MLFTAKMHGCLNAEMPAFMHAWADVGTADGWSRDH